MRLSPFYTRHPHVLRQEADAPQTGMVENCAGNTHQRMITLMKFSDSGKTQGLAALLLAVCCLNAGAQAQQGFKEAPQRRIESTTKNAYCEKAKGWYRACYIPCAKKTSKVPMSHAVNHCNANCQNELVWANYLCRRDPYLPMTND